MLFDPKDAECVKLSAMCLAKCLEGEELFEITRKGRRTLNQNAYLHLLLQYLASRLTLRMEYVKREYYKKIVNPDIFKYKMYDQIKHTVVEDLRSSKDLTREEMTLSIDRLKIWSAEVPEIVLPDAVEKENGKMEIVNKDFYKEVLKEINAAKRYI